MAIFVLECVSNNIFKLASTLLATNQNFLIKCFNLLILIPVIKEPTQILVLPNFIGRIRLIDNFKCPIVVNLLLLNNLLALIRNLIQIWLIHLSSFLFILNWDTHSLSYQFKLNFDCILHFCIVSENSLKLKVWLASAYNLLYGITCLLNVTFCTLKRHSFWVDPYLLKLVICLKLITDFFLQDIR